MAQDVNVKIEMNKKRRCLNNIKERIEKMSAPDKKIDSKMSKGARKGW